MDEFWTFSRVFRLRKLQNCNLTKNPSKFANFGSKFEKIRQTERKSRIFRDESFLENLRENQRQIPALTVLRTHIWRFFFLVLNILNEFSRVFLLYFYIYFWARGSAELPSIWRIFSAQILIFLKMSRKTSVYNSYLSQNPRLHFLSQFWVKIRVFIFFHNFESKRTENVKGSPLSKQIAAPPVVHRRN